MALPVARVELDRLQVRGDRVLQPLEQVVGDAELVEVAAVVGVELGDGLVLVGGLGVVAAVLVQVAEQRAGHRELGIGAGGVLEGGDGLVAVAGALGADGLDVLVDAGRARDRPAWRRPSPRRRCCRSRAASSEGRAGRRAARADATRAAGGVGIKRASGGSVATTRMITRAARAVKATGLCRAAGSRLTGFPAGSTIARAAVGTAAAGTTPTAVASASDNCAGAGPCAATPHALAAAAKGVLRATADRRPRLQRAEVRRPRPRQDQAVPRRHPRRRRRQHRRHRRHPRRPHRRPHRSATPSTAATARA